jgi:hypothetical protein
MQKANWTLEPMLASIGRATASGRVDGEASSEMIRPPAPPMKKLARFLLAVNLAFVIRLIRYGLTDALVRLRSMYFGLAPFERKPTPAEIENARRAQAEFEAVSAQREAIRAQREASRAQLNAIKEVDLAELVDSSTTVTLEANVRYENGAMPVDQLVMLMALLRQQRPEIVVEIGTFNGTTAKAMALNLPGATIHTVDLPPDFDPGADPNSIIPKDDFHLIGRRRVGEAFANDPRCVNIVQHFVDSADWDFQAAKGATFCLIDGSHTYEYCKNDTEKVLAIAGPDSLIIWHDCDDHHPGVVAFLHEFQSRGHNVIRLRNTYFALMKTGSAQ